MILLNRIGDLIPEDSDNMRVATSRVLEATDADVGIVRADSAAS